MTRIYAGLLGQEEDARVPFGVNPVAYLRLYGRDFPDRLAAAGFVVTLHQPSVELSPELARRYGLIADPEVMARYPAAPPDEIYVATRPR